MCGFLQSCWHVAWLGTGALPLPWQVYGPETETLVMEEDAQPLEVPIVKPVREVKLEVKQREAPPTHYSTE